MLKNISEILLLISIYPEYLISNALVNKEAISFSAYAKAYFFLSTIFDLKYENNT